MNTFANSLFSWLFSWARELIQRVWNSSVTGRYSSFFDWLGDHWLAVTVVICAVGTLIDLAVWIFRWRPDLVWRTRYRKLTGRRAAEEDVIPAEPPPMEAVIDAEEEMDVPPSAWQDVWNTPVTASFYQLAVPESRNETLVFQQTTGDVYNTPPVDAVGEPLPEWARNENATLLSSVPRRRREKNRKSRENRRRILEMPELIRNDISMLDGLPPPVDQAQVFNAPAYPQENSGASPYSGWQPPGVTGAPRA